jgi:superfamily II DNA or RNA helicase
VDIFRLRTHVIDDYADYTRSFLTILDPAIRDYVDQALNQGTLWPDALIQLSPAYDHAGTVADLVHTGVLHPLCATIFRAPDRDGTLRSLRLYRHQRQAIDLAAQRQHFVVTTGTGSGKSLTYTLPIMDHVLRTTPAAGKVRAIIVYPMNALINSQEKAIARFLDNLPADQQVITYARYTGQESEARKQAIQQQPPHILLTNYVMLELMLTRPDEFPFVDADTTDLQFVVLDELHTYRGRQGADVALLLRRLRERCGNPNLTCIGTSATMVSGDAADDRRSAVAAVAGTIFGVSLTPDQVIEETLTYAVPTFGTPTADDLRAALHTPFPETLDWATFQQHPLAHWIEQTFSLREDAGGMLRRADPRTLQQGAELLAQQTGHDPVTCAARLQQFFSLGTTVRGPDGNPGFAFKLHQFIAQGSAVYSTLEPPDQRYLTLEGQRFVAGPQGDRLLFPLVFCRECGQHYALCAYDAQAHRLEPRQPMSRGEDVAEPARPGYLLVGAEVWREEDEDLLPENWFTITRRGRRIKPAFRDYLPRRLQVLPDGQVQEHASDTTITGWFLPTPFLTCLRCGVVYTRRDKDDFRKLARLSSEGRSTATTLITVTTIDAMRHSPLPEAARKLLSFTDNRQDASLQAGHFNDFAGVTLLRSAIAAALAAHPPDDPLTHLTVAREVCQALALPQAAYAKSVGAYGGARRRNEEALQALLEYRIFEDLRRSWRITQPNLEQCGLLRIDYLDLEELCHDPEPWQAHPVLRDCPPDQRVWTIRAVLEHMRRELAIDAPCLDRDQQGELVRKVTAALRDPWTFAEEESNDLRTATRFVVPSDDPLPPGGRSLGVRGRLGRFLRSPHAWPSLTEPLDEAAYEHLLQTLLDILVGTHILIDVATQGPRAVQIRRDALLWRPGDGTAPSFDPVRDRRLAGVVPIQPRVNAFFQRFYRQPLASLRTIEGREHTGQVHQTDREQREEQFRTGTLPVLFCSPTMELGIDIADLNVVHLRNVPPTPANYAQRSGRAGRSGQPALVLTYCSTGSGHDQYFFQRPRAMVAGAVAAPQIELANEDLIRAHVHAVWLSFTQLDLTRSMLSLMDTRQPDYPLHDEVARRLELTPAQRQACQAVGQRILQACRPDRAGASWFTPQWLDATLDHAPQAFADACDRWRDLYTAADAQLQEARRAIDQFHQGAATREERDEALQRQQEALRQKDLLCNVASRSHSDADFYPYRYFASEGFLPGYNFPRLPVRAFLPTERTEGNFLARPRFLALTEFGPQNVIYHEGRKYRVTRTILPAGDVQRRFVRARICRICGYFHEGTDDDVCAQCGTPLTTQRAQVLPNLFEMTTVTTRRVDRITCEEEERLREGFALTTHYQFSRGHGHLRRDTATVQFGSGNGGTGTYDLTYGPAATIWRINHGWRRSRQPGFALDLRTGRWGRQPGGEDIDTADDVTGSSVRTGIRIVVRDTRNLLVLVPAPAVSANLEQLTSLQYALEQGIAAAFQLEAQELTSERLGEGRQSRIIYWEAAEGGAGVLRRLVEEPDALARVARAALDICHYDPDNGQEHAAGECRRACYRCLLAYSNQPVHHLLDRRLVRDLLLELTRATVVLSTPATSTAAAAPAADIPPATRRVLDYLQAHGGRLPDAIQPDISGRHPHLVYQPTIVLLCPEPGEAVATMQNELEDAGYTVIVIMPDDDIAARLAPFQFWRSSP